MLLLSIRGTEQLLQNILEKCSTPAFAKTVENMHKLAAAKKPPDVMHLRAQIATLFHATVNDDVENAGFPGLAENSYEMFHAIHFRRNDGGVLKLVHCIEQRLRVEVGSFFGCLEPGRERVLPALSSAQALEIIKAVRTVWERGDCKAAIATAREKLQGQELIEWVCLGFLGTWCKHIALAFNFGFEAYAMCKAFEAMQPLAESDTLVAKAALRLEKLLNLPPGWLGLAQTGKEVGVVVKHAIQGNEVKVRISTTAMLGELKQVIAERLGNKDIVTAGQFVRKQGVGFSSCSEAERIAGKRTFLMLGVEFRVAEAKKAKPKATSEAKVEITADQEHPTPEVVAPALSLNQALKLQEEDPQPASTCSKDTAIESVHEFDSLNTTVPDM